MIASTKQPSVKRCSEEARDKTDKHSPAGLNEVVFLLMVGGVHVFGAGSTDGFHVSEQYPVQEETIIPVDKKPHAIADTKSRPEVVRACQPHDKKQ